MWLLFTKKTLVMVSLIMAGLMAAFLHFSPLVYLEKKVEPRGYIAIVIDDFGNYGECAEDMLQLDIPLTAAVMPFLPYSQNDAQMAHEAGLEIILHLPLEPLQGKPHWLGPRGITSSLSNEEIKNICILSWKKEG